jgi:CDP-6-deoxy-D-xylo-4-hexulose-3-dehydrase
MRNIPLNDCTFGEDEIQASIEVLRSGHLTMGPNCFSFEDRFAREVGAKNAVFVNSGSSANLLAFFSLVNPTLKDKIEPGSEVIVPAVTWSTTIWPVVQAGLIPVLVDSDPRTFQMDLAQVKAAIGPKTAAICPVHVLGNAVEMDALMKLAKEKDLWVVEDTCEALGTKQNGRDAGTFGDIGTYSFYFSHHITTIEGGMVVTNDNDLAELMRCMRAHGWTRHMKTRSVVEAKYPEIDSRFLFVNTGFNLRPTEINAAFGLKQIEKLRGFNQARVRNAEFWNKEFAQLIQAGHFHPMKTTAGTSSTWFGYPVICRDRKVRAQLGSHLEKNGIETRPIICGNLARQPAFKLIPHRIAGKLTGADEIMDCGLFWGSHPVMSQEDLDYVAATVKGFFGV